jgi:hypothetical protein
MDQLPQLSQLQPGQPIKAEHLRALTDAVLQILKVSGSPPIKVSLGNGGLVISLGRPIPEFPLWGKWEDDVAKGDTGTVLISTGNGIWTDSGNTLDEVVNVPADASAGDLVNVGFMYGVPEGYPRECPS